jgi:hypothetical protein
VSHTDPEILALRALGEMADAAWNDEHTQTCARCRAELTRLTKVVGLARAGGPPEPLEVPPPAVWNQIAAEVATGTAPSQEPPVPGRGNPRQVNGAARVPSRDPRAASGEDRPVSEPPSGPRRAGRRGRLVTALAAGLIIGIGGTAGVVQLTRAPATRVVAHIELAPLPQFPQWQGTSGMVVMRADAGQQVIAVTLNAPRRPGFYEVWLLARNGVSMISLGDLNAGHTGTFTIPPGTDLRDYSRIDVSLQPFNGSTVHVKTSVVRGSLPSTALGAPPPAG